MGRVELRLRLWLTLTTGMCLWVVIAQDNEIWSLAVWQSTSDIGRHEELVVGGAGAGLAPGRATIKFGLSGGGQCGGSMPL